MTPPCPFCGRTRDFQYCWIDPAHGAYYSQLRRAQAEGTQPPKPLVEAQPFPDAEISEPVQLDLFEDA